MDYNTWFAERLTQLRMEKGVSARDMSLSLGQSESYINKIENRRTLPSMSGFFYICEYLEVAPQDFFDPNTVSPGKTAEIKQKIGCLSRDKADHILQLIQDLTE
ncbi:MAG: helix-turn-helix transcriptional regulator [Oscillospiraceae bacterium]|nr:helix-turn-helix transcriptional regulator [Oscillospiraceae bacterium]